VERSRKKGEEGRSVRGTPEALAIMRSSFFKKRGDAHAGKWGRLKRKKKKSAFPSSGGRKRTVREARRLPMRQRAKKKKKIVEKREGDWPAI